MEDTPEQAALRAAATAWAKAERRRVARELTDVAVYLPERNPVSVFMAGSPGAGKTEASKELLKEVLKGSDRQVIRIDADELRAHCPGYNGGNASLFQGAASILLEKIHDLVVEQSQSFLLDGTLSNYDKAHKNISRSLGRGRTVQILYVYQEPALAWEFVQKRELAEGRHIPPQDFVNQYFGARETVNALKSAFKDRIKVDLLLKNLDGSNRFYRNGVDQIDSHIPENYDRAQVGALVGLA